jgi:hypothetical protein
MLVQLSLRSCATAVVAVIGAGLIYLPPPPAIDFGQPSVALAAAWDIVDVAGPIDAAVSGFVDLPVRATSLGAGFDAGEVAQLADAGGGVGTADDPLSEWFSAPGVSAGLAEADPFTDFFQQISNYLQGAFLLGVLVFGGVVANVAQFFSDAYDWFAGIFGFEPYGAMDTLGGALPEIETALLAPALASDLGAALGDIAVIPALDFAGGADVEPMVDDGGIIGALLSGLAF